MASPRKSDLSSRLPGTKYHPRAITGAIESASTQFPVLFLTGPRQVGKTTLLRWLADEDRQYVSLDDPDLRALAQRDPALLLQRFPAPVLIDEVQYAPQLLPLIKMIVDDNPRRHSLFWLTGSQQFQMMKGITETLAGRVAILNLLGFTSRERRKRHAQVSPFVPTPVVLTERSRSAAQLTVRQVYSDIWVGSFPALATKTVKDRDLYFSSLLQTYLERDVRDLAQVGDRTAFLRLLKAVAARTAQLLNLSDLARDADISVNTAKHWLSVLQASFQISLVPAYHSNITKRLVKTTKLFFLDTGLCSYLTEWPNAQTLEAGAMSGALLETYAYTEILKSWWNAGKQPLLYHYRDKEKNEVDFLIVQGGKVYPVEVKKSASPRLEWLSRFKALDRLPEPLSHAGLVCLSRKRFPLSRNAEVVPIGFL